jgi:hypothetical protein
MSPTEVEAPMRGLASYLLAGILVVLALDVIAPPVGLGLARARPAIDVPPVQSVVRINKGDRLNILGKQQEPQKRPAMLVGCDPVFSPLSASAKANYSGRCIA